MLLLRIDSIEDRHTLLLYIRDRLGARLVVTLIYLSATTFTLLLVKQHRAIAIMSSDSIPEKMRAATIKDFKKGYEIKDIDVPTDLGPNDLLVKIAAAGYCHTDLQVMEGVYESQGAKPGLVGSHEPVGTVVKAGSDAGKSGIKVGDRVGSINTYGFCGKCDSCKQGKQLCDNMPACSASPSTAASRST